MEIEQSLYTTSPRWGRGRDLFLPLRAVDPVPVLRPLFCVLGLPTVPALPTVQGGLGRVHPEQVPGGVLRGNGNGHGKGAGRQL